MNILAIPMGHGLSKPTSGGQNRFSNIVGELARKGNKVVVLERSDLIDPQDHELATIYTYKDYRLFKRTLTMFRDLNIDFALQILRIVRNEKIDIIHIRHPSGTSAARLVATLSRNRIPVVYSAHNVECNMIMDGFAKDPNYTKFEKLVVPAYIKFLEKLACRHLTQHVLAVSDEDKNIFVTRYNLPTEKVTVIPSGCYISPPANKESKESAKKGLGIDLDKIVILFHGLFSWPPNKDAFELIESYIAPRFTEINDRVVFILGGTGVPVFERANIKSLGFIEDLDEALAAADIAIVPIVRGAGTRTKILDYLGVGLPIVTTKKGIEGINARNGEEALITDDVDEEFIELTAKLVNSVEERQRIGTNAHRLADREYNWYRIGDRLHELYQHFVNERW